MGVESGAELTDLRLAHPHQIHFDLLVLFLVFLGDTPPTQASFSGVAGSSATKCPLSSLALTGSCSTTGSAAGAGAGLGLGEFPMS